jgi:hypothetical protein
MAGSFSPRRCLTLSAGGRRSDHVLAVHRSKDLIAPSLGRRWIGAPVTVTVQVALSIVLLFAAAGLSLQRLPAPVTPAIGAGPTLAMRFQV